MKTAFRTGIYLAVSSFLLFTASCTTTPPAKEEAAPVTEEATPAAPEYVGEEITYSTDSTNMNGYIAYDKNSTEKKPGILVIHEWWGHNDYARKRADMLAKLGYVAIAVDMYGDGQQADHPEGAMKFAMSVMGNLEEAEARFTKAIEQLKANPNVDPEKIGAIGYCFGGSVAMSMANAGLDLDAVAAFHSGVQLPIQPEAGKVKARVLVCNGADDPFIPADQVDAFKASMDAAGVDYKYIAYEGAVHAFTNPGADELGEKFELPLAYQKEADEASWAELTKMLAEVF